MWIKLRKLLLLHCEKSVQIRSFFWYVFFRTRAEYGDLLPKSPYSARIRGNTDKKIFGRFSRSVNSRHHNDSRGIFETKSNIYNGAFL